MWRSEPQIPLASTLTSASSAAPSSGSGFSSTRTWLGAWKVTARISARTVSPPRRGAPSGGDRLLLLLLLLGLRLRLGDLEAIRSPFRAGGDRDPRLERELLLEVGGL